MGWYRLSLDAPGAGFDYYRYNITDGRVYRHALTGFNAVGSPVYRDLNVNDPIGAALPGINSANVYQNPPNFFAKAPDGSLYVMMNVDTVSWANAKVNRMFKLGPDGALRWGVGEHIDRPGGSKEPPPPPGKIYTFKVNVGVVKDCVVANDFDGGWDGEPAAITYCWDKDGLWVGGLFESPDLSNGKPLWHYNHSTDNGAGEVQVDPATGDVL